MRALFSLALLGFAAAIVVSAAEAPAAAKPEPATPTKIKVLLVDGFSNHDWKRNTALLKAILEPTGLFDLTVSTTPPPKSTEGWDQWRPNFKDYGAVIQTCNDINNNGPLWPEQVRKDFEDYVRNGGGVYIYHSAQNAFANWEAYNEIIGLGWRPASYGTAIAIDADEKIVTRPPGEGRNTSHAPKGEVVIHLLGAHPIHDGMPKAWKTTALEVYYYARGPAKNVTVLSYARDPRFGENWPIEWTVDYGKGRVYVATFGHFWRDDVDAPEALRCAGVQTNIVRALEWLARRPVTFPIPKDFPTESQLSLRPPPENLANTKPADAVPTVPAATP